MFPDLRNNLKSSGSSLDQEPSAVVGIYYKSPKSSGNFLRTMKSTTENTKSGGKAGNPSNGLEELLETTGGQKRRVEI